MSRRTVLALTAGTVLLGGLAAPALADPILSDEPTQVCVLTHYDPQTNDREGLCVWVPVGGGPLPLPTR